MRSVSYAIDVNINVSVISKYGILVPEYKGMLKWVSQSVSYSILCLQLTTIFCPHGPIRFPFAKKSVQKMPNEKSELSPFVHKKNFQV